MATDLAISEAAKCNRVPMTVEAFAASDLNGWRNAYWFSDDAEDFGADPWSVIEGVDPNVNGVLFDVWLESGKSLDNLPGRTTIFVAAKHLAEIAEAR